MSSTSAQVKLTLSQELYEFLKSRANRLGLPASTYVKNLIIDDVKDMEYSVFKMSAKRERVALKALENYKKGKTKKIKEIDKYLSNL